MKSATASFKLYALVLLLTFSAFLIFLSTKTFAQTLEHHSQCVAIYINNTPVIPGGTYSGIIKPGEKFHAEIKMKNLGFRAWKASENYRLGSSFRESSYNDSTQFGTARIELPSNKNIVNSGEEVTFAWDPILSANSAIGQTYGFSWQMLREGSGRFGDYCVINIKTAKTPSPSPSPSPLPSASPLIDSKVTILPNTACISSDTNTQEVSVKWKPIDTANSYQVNLYEPGGAVGGINCVNKDTVNAGIFTFQFPSNPGKAFYPYSADKTYSIAVTPSTSSTCAGNFGRNISDRVPVLNGISGALLAKNTDFYRLNSITYNVNNTNYPYQLNTCRTSALSLPGSAINNGRIPVKIKIDKKIVDSKTTSDIGKTVTKEITVFFKYGSENNPNEVGESQ